MGTVSAGKEKSRGCVIPQDNIRAEAQEKPNAGKEGEKI